MYARYEYFTHGFFPARYYPAYYFRGSQYVAPSDKPIIGIQGTQDAYLLAQMERARQQKQEGDFFQIIEIIMKSGISFKKRIGKTAILQ